jgi:hypothetical protein
MEVQTVLETLEFARQVFETKVAPVLRKWGYSVSPLAQCNPYEVEWKVGEEGGLKVRLFVSYRNSSDCELMFCGGISHPTLKLLEKPLTEAAILSKFKYAVEAEIVWQCRQQLAKLFATANAVLFYPQARQLEWEVKDGKIYRCSFSASLYKATWCWDCKVYPLKKPGLPDYDNEISFQLVPTDESQNPASALIQVARVSIAEVLL